MGADLYINKLQKQCRRKNIRNFNRWCKKRDIAEENSERRAFCQAKVSLYCNKMYERGYFRDSYNSSSVMWRLGLSWWEDIGKMIDSESNLTVEKARELRDIVATTPLTLAKSVEELKEAHCGIEGMVDPVKEWNDYFKDKKLQFIDFLDEAIRLREPIYCSC